LTFIRLVLIVPFECWIIINCTLHFNFLAP
jgi:hypothetical protein